MKCKWFEHRVSSARYKRIGGAEIWKTNLISIAPGLLPRLYPWWSVFPVEEGSQRGEKHGVLLAQCRDCEATPWAVSVVSDRKREGGREGERDRYNQTGEEYHRWNHAARSFWWNLAHAVKCEPSKCHVQLIRRYLHSPFMFGPKKNTQRNSSFLTRSQLKHLLIYLLYLVGNRTRPSQRYMWITILCYHDLPHRLAVVVVIAPSERCLPDYRPQFCITRQCQSEIMFVFLQNNYVLLHAPTTLIQFKASLAKKKKPWTKLRVGVDTCN